MSHVTRVMSHVTHTKVLATPQGSRSVRSCSLIATETEPNASEVVDIDRIETLQHPQRLFSSPVEGLDAFEEESPHIYTEFSGSMSGGPELKDRSFLTHIKVFFRGEKRRTSNLRYLKQFKHEIQVVARLRHNHLVSTFGAVMHADKVMIVMELMQYGSLYDILRNDTLEINDDMAVDILHDITNAMVYLHSQKDPVVHRHLSTNNVLLDRNLNAKRQMLHFRA